MARYIVLVDDEQGIRKALTRELDDWARERELEIRTFPSGDEALLFLSESHLDVVLVLSDQRMPGIKGHEFLAACNQRYPEIILLMLTGYTDINDITRAIRSGITSFILKPWEHDDLIYEMTKAYNIFEARDKNRRYLQLIKNEISLAALLRAEVAWRGFHRYRRSSIGGANRISGEQTARGVDLIQHAAISEHEVLLLAAHVESDGVRGSMIGGALLQSIVSALLFREEGASVDIASLYEGLARILKKVEKELPEVIVRYTLGVLDERDPALHHTGNGYPPWVVLREEGFGEIEVDATHPGRVKNTRLQAGDLIGIASPGLLSAMQDPAEPRGPRVFARRLPASIGAGSLAERAERILAESDAAAGDTDRTVMLIQVGDAPDG